MLKIRNFAPLRALPALTLAWLCLWPSPYARASVAEGVEKWQAGQFSAAVAQWQPYAARGDADALFNLGQAYKLGRGVAKDSKIAQSYYRRAAEKGHAPAATNLGILIAQNGNKSEAARWWRLAALRGEVRAQYMLGVMFFNGDGVARNVALAHALMQSAARAGFDQAKSALERMTPLITADVRKTSDELSARLAVGEENIIPGTSPILVAKDKNIATARNISINTPASSKTTSPTAPPSTTTAASSAAPASGTATAAAKTTGTAAKTSGPAAKTTSTSLDSQLAATAVTAPLDKASGTSGGQWRVQIGAYTQQQAAEVAWQNLLAANRKMLAGFSPFYEPHDSIIRLQISGAADRLTAKALCDKLTAIGKSCFVIRGS